MNSSVVTNTAYSITLLYIGRCNYTRCVVLLYVLRLIGKKTKTVLVPNVSK